MNEWINEWMSGEWFRKIKTMREWMNEGMNKWISEWMNDWER